MATQQSVGQLLRHWRQQRRLTQLAFACEAEISTRHLSFLETGRSRPSREMLLRLAELLEVPLRERNVMLTAAGFSMQFKESSLDGPLLPSMRHALDLVLQGHEPNPAMAVDRYWNLVASNAGSARLGFAITPKNVNPQLLVPPVNMLRLSLHPEGIASCMLNLAEWRAHLLARLRRQVDMTADKVLADLLAELMIYPAPPMPHDAEIYPEDSVVVPLRYATPSGTLSFISTITVFATPIDTTLSELALECLYPADAHTAARLRAMAAEGEGLTGSPSP